MKTNIHPLTNSIKQDVYSIIEIDVKVAKTTSEITITSQSNSSRTLLPAQPKIRLETFRNGFQNAFTYGFCLFLQHRG
ncbi:hypothetical protein HXY33_01770 [Candidatus Bathyarchaeota archaeon]|nr:hypothetical protein [Candidatus Bathyarchaeota archaeon]